MDRFLQLAQNYWIRFVGFLYRLWAIVRQIFTAAFGFLAQLFGLTQPTQYVEQSAKESESAAPPTTNSTPAASAETSFSARYVSPSAARRSTDNMDYYRRLARQIQNPD